MNSRDGVLIQWTEGRTELGSGFNLQYLDTEGLFQVLINDWYFFFFLVKGLLKSFASFEWLFSFLLMNSLF